MELAKRRERAQSRLTEIRTEQQRQMQYAGKRLGVFAALKELSRKKRKAVRLIERLSAIGGEVK